MFRFFTGLTAGLVIGYLTAPRPGKDTRQQLTEFVDEELEGFKLLKGQWDNTMAQVRDLVGNLKAASGFLSGEERTVYQRTPIQNSYNTAVNRLADSAKIGVEMTQKGMPAS